MEIMQTNDGCWIAVRDGLPTPVGLTGKFETKEAVEKAIAWYYSQNVIA